MFLYDLEFYPDLRRVSAEEYEDHVAGLLGALYKNGQLIHGWSGRWHQMTLRVRAIAPGEDAFDRRHYNRWVWNDWFVVAEESREAPSFIQAGPSWESEGPCRCETSSSFYLFTTFLSSLPPVRCGDCSRSVPLYRLPYLGREDEHGSILSWASAYQACDTLWMGSAAGEVFAYRQLSHVRSELTVQGRAICAELTVRMGRPFYYFLLKYHVPADRTCPGCGGAWIADGRRGFMEHRCDACRLFSENPKDDQPIRRPRRLRDDERRR